MKNYSNEKLNPERIPRINYYEKHSIKVTEIGPRNSLKVSPKIPQLILEGKNNVVYKQ